MADINSSKRALRQTLRTWRRAITPDLQLAAANALIQHAVGVAQCASARHIGAYVASDGEIDPAPLLARWRTAGKAIYLPVVTGDRQLEFARWEGRLGPPNRYGIPEPSPNAPKLSGTQLDILLLPTVGFDRTGNRLGMGAGFYDRLLAEFATNAEKPLLIAVAYAGQYCEQLPCDPWDQAVDGILTEAGYQEIGRAGAGQVGETLGQPE